MKSIKISIQYKYLNSEVGVIPFIKIGYINECNNELDAYDVCGKKINNARIPGTGYYYGKTIDGKWFKVSEKEKIPANAKHPIFFKKAEYNIIEDFTSSDIEITVKKSILESLKSLGNGTVISYCDYDSSGKVTSGAEKISNFNTPKNENSLISGVHLDYTVEAQSNYSIEDKVSLVSMIIIHLYQSLAVKKIGFTKDNEDLYKIISFEINGLNMDLIKNAFNFEEVVYNAILNRVNTANQEIAENNNAKSNKKNYCLSK